LKCLVCSGAHLLHQCPSQIKTCQAECSPAEKKLCQICGQTTSQPSTAQTRRSNPDNDLRPPRSSRQ
jgi:hypothetical protein